MKKFVSLLLIFVMLFGINIVNLKKNVYADENMKVRAWSGIPEYLDEKTKPFDLTVEIIDTKRKAYDSIEAGSASATLESEEFALEDPSVLPEIRQLSITDIQGSLRFKVKFKNVVYIGKESSSEIGKTSSNKYGTISVSVSYRVDDEVISGTATFSVKKPKSEIRDAQIKTSVKPVLKLSRYSYGSHKIMPGDTFDLSFSLTNTSWKYSLENIKMVIDGGNIFAPADGTSNVFYDEILGPQGKIDKKIKLYVGENARESLYPIKITINAEYTGDSKKEEYSDDISTYVPVVAKCPKLMVTVRAYTKEKEISEGEDVSLKIVAKNTTIVKEGETPPIVYNPVLKVEGLNGNDFDSDARIFDLKNLMAGGDPVDKVISITPKYKRTPKPENSAATPEAANTTESPTQPEEPQIFEGVVCLTYMDQDHKEYTTSSNFSFKINPQPQENDSMDMGMGNTGMENNPEMPEGNAPEQKQEKKHSWKFWAIISSVSVIVLVGIIIVIKKVKAKRNLDLDADDEDI